jgi:chemotaxis protein methyltransferase CheR
MGNESAKQSPFSQPALTPITVAVKDFNFFRQAIRELTGIALSDAKKELVQSRLRSRVQALGLEGFGAYRAHLEGLPREHSEWQAFINLLTTNKTDWFREMGHFDYLIREFLPAWKKLGKKKLSVWSSACSTGEEPYTLSMVLNRQLANSGCSYSIFATDLDTEVLRHASNGVYKRSQLYQIPPEYKGDSFSLGSGEISEWMKIKSHLRAPITFEQFNLNSARYPWEDRFDLIFCRNVLIYFPKEVINQVIAGSFQAATRGGVLCIGHSESLQNLKHSWKYVKPSILMKEGLK